MEVFQVLPYARNLRRLEGISVGREVLDDSPDGESAMLFPPAPRGGAIQLGLGIVGFVGAACGPRGNLVFLVGGEKEVAVRADGEVL